MNKGLYKSFIHLERRRQHNFVIDLISYKTKVSIDTTEHVCIDVITNDY